SAQAGSASPPNATKHYVPPQDLAHNLTSSQAVLWSPLVLLSKSKDCSLKAWYPACLFKMKFHRLIYNMASGLQYINRSETH
ncbi:hypothetical protein L0F63_006966, partial [Massospora cicadina]